MAEHGSTEYRRALVDQHPEDRADPVGKEYAEPGMAPFRQSSLDAHLEGVAPAADHRLSGGTGDESGHETGGEGCGDRGEGRAGVGELGEDERRPGDRRDAAGRSGASTGGGTASGQQGNEGEGQAAHRDLRGGRPKLIGAGPLDARRAAGGYFAVPTWPSFVGLFDHLRDQLDQLLARATVPPTPREAAAATQQHLVDLKVGLEDLRRGYAVTERELAEERAQLVAADRRGQLATEIQDAETVRIATEFTAKHQERVEVLERKLAVQRDEVAMAEREATVLLTRLKQARQGLTPEGRTPSAEAAWRGLEAAGGVRPETDLESELLKTKYDRAAMEQAADAQLAHLKKKLGKE